MQFLKFYFPISICFGVVVSRKKGSFAAGLIDFFFTYSIIL